MNIFSLLNLVLAFLLELAMLAAFSFWGFSAGKILLTKLLLGLGIPVLVAVLWGLFMAPKAKQRLQGVAYLAARLFLFGLSAVLLYLAGQTTLAVIYASLIVLNTVLLYAWKDGNPVTG